MELLLIIWVICAIICVYQRMMDGMCYVFVKTDYPDELDIVLEYLIIAFISPYILFLRAWGK
jgi:hypothetical protein